MKKFAKSFLCIMLAIVICFSLFGCSKKVEVTEDSVTQTVGIALEALHEFNTDDLKKYVDSQTLSYIVSLAEDHEQFAELGRAMFSSLSIEIKSIDLNAKTVTVDVMNKDLYSTASNFAYDLTSNYSTLEMLSLLKDEYFLDSSLADLTKSINEEPEPYQSKEVVLNIVEGKKNLMVSVDEVAEDAISGGALSAVKSVIG